MFSERSINLKHPGYRQPTGSAAAKSLNYLSRKGYDVLLDPYTENDLVGQYIELDFMQWKGKSLSQVVTARNKYTAWRDSVPDGHLFLMSNHLGRLAASGWIAPRDSDEEHESGVPTKALGQAKLYEKDSNLGAHFLRITHAVAFRRFPFAAQGIMMENVRSRVLMAASAAIGYTAVGGDFNELATNSGIRGVDMVVSSGPLDNLIRRNTAENQLPAVPSVRPDLRLIQGELGD